MAEIRKNLVTGEYVVLSAERTRSPRDFTRTEPLPSLPPEVPDCPFCPEHEHFTPGETYRQPAMGPWRVRCFPNKFTALDAGGETWRRSQGTCVSSAAVGPHEVLVESRRHDESLATMSEADVQAVMRAYHHRFKALYRDPRVEHVVLFKNHGVKSGTTLEHPHAQVVGLPLTPVQFRRRAEDAFRYHDEKGGCLLCAVAKEELEARERVVVETSGFLAFVPFAALSPFHLWVVPRRHASCFGGALPSELDDLGAVLHTVLAKLHQALGNPDYNLVMLSAPPDVSYARHVHWYVSIVPRVCTRAGFELGTGMYINTCTPESSAAFLRDVAV
jgi:UDPglucose--hexose-1-phosphate uridylyltransferase